MSSREACIQVRMKPGGLASVWVRREPGDVATAVLGEVGGDGWAPVVLACDVVVGEAGVRFDPMTVDDDDVDDSTEVFAIEQMMMEPRAPLNPQPQNRTWPVARPVEEIREVTKHPASQLGHV